MSRKQFQDLFHAIKGEEHFAQNTGLVDKTFDTKKKVVEKETMIMNSLHEAENEYRKKRNELHLIKL